MNSDIQFEFKGFNPDYNFKNMISLVADKIYYSAPSDSSMKLAIRKAKGVIQAYCRIGSQAGTFVAVAMSNNPKQALQKIERKISTQLNSWKSKRYEAGVA